MMMHESLLHFFLFETVMELLEQQKTQNFVARVDESGGIAA